MKNYKDIEIADRGGDLNKRWYVHYLFLKPGSSTEYKSFRVKQGINRFHTKTERMEAARLLRSEMELMLSKGFNPFIEGGARFLSADMSFGDAIKYYEENHVIHTGDRSQGNYRSTMKLVQSKIFPTTPLNTINSNKIREALNQLQRERGHGNRSRNNILKILLALFNFLCNDEEVALRDNPCKRIKPLPEDAPTQNTPATNEQFEKIVKHLYENNKNLLLAWCFVLYLAVRTSELGKIQRKQIMRYKDNLAITLSGQNVKNKKSRLQLIPPHLANLMLELDIAKLPEEHYIFSYSMKPNEVPWPCFRSRSSELWRKQVKEVLNLDVNLYSAKHYQASALASNGIDPRQIQNWADHKDIATTHNYIRSSVPRVTVDMMDDLVKLPIYP